MKRSSQIRILFFILIVCVFLQACTQVPQNQPYYPSKNEWLTKKPGDLGINEEKLNTAVEFALNNEYEGDKNLREVLLKTYANEPYYKILGPVSDRGGPAGIILKNGYIIAQWGDIERVDMTFSVAKSYLSTVAGLALDAGLIGNVHDKAADYVKDGSFSGDHNSKITWHHLLNQSSDWSGSLFGIYDWADRPPSEGTIEDWKNRKLNEPGTKFKYNDVRVNLLAYSLLQVWRKSLPDVLKEKIMDPIGASSTWQWHGYENSYVDIDGKQIQSVSGGGHFGGGLFINTLDHARFGLLFLRRGNWQGKQLVSQKWVDMVQQSSEANSNYGYLWWLNKGNNPWEGTPSSVYYAAGFGGNYIIVDNEHDLVIVTRWIKSSKINEMVKLVLMSNE